MKFRKLDTMYLDVECYINYFYVGLKRKSDGKRLGFEYSKRSPTPNWAHLKHLLRRYKIVTFNGKAYDMPMVKLAMSGATNAELKIASDKIIKGGIKYWNVEEELGIKLDSKIDHVDLIEPNPAVRASLKALNGRLHGERLQDLPFHESTVLTDEEMDITGDYCLHSDLDATENLDDSLKEDLELRCDLSVLYDRDMRSMSDAQLGEAIVKIRYEQMTGKKPKKLDRKVTSFKYKPPEFIAFNSPMLQDVLETICNTTIVVGSDGKVEFPASWNFDIRFGDTKLWTGPEGPDPTRYKLGIGGLHSMESNRGVKSDNQYVLIDADVASQYPKIIMLNGLYPKALGPEFLTIYNGAIEARIQAKNEGKRLKALESTPAIVEQLKMLTVQDKGGKIQLNGVYGKLGSIYSVLYAPHMLIATTLTGQLTLLMLIEAAEELGIHIVSANTDGVVFKVPREMYNGMVLDDNGKPTDKLMDSKLKELTSWWEKLTGFTLEFAEYAAIYNRDVNSYFAIKPNGKAKRKGTFANHWHPDSPDYSIRSQLMKNPQMTVCGDAALAHILYGTNIESFIRKYDDIRGFLTVINATGGATWREGYLGKVVRFIWSTDGDPIIKVKANDKGTNPKVPKTDGCRPIMTLPDELPDDIDYDRYVAETKQILIDVGFLPPPPVPYNVTKAGATKFYKSLAHMMRESEKELKQMRKEGRIQ